MAEPEDAAYLQTQLLPHKLAFDDPSNPSTPARDTSQAESSNLEFFQERTTSFDGRSSCITARVDTEMQDCGDKNNGEAPLQHCDTSNNATIAGFAGPNQTPNVLPTASDSNIEMMNTTDDRLSLDLSFQARLGSISPSLLCSDWDGSPRDHTVFTLPEGTAKTHWLHSYNQLKRLFGGTMKQLEDVITIGDSFLQEDAHTFISNFYRRWSLEDPWSRLAIKNPTSRGPLTDKILKSLHCAETMENDSFVDPVKLRMARVLLHHYFEQMCIKLNKDRSQCNLSSGRGVATVAKDAVLETIYGCRMKYFPLKIRRRCERSFKWHTRIGKRWSYVASHLGTGILLTCSRNLEIHM
jgi:hypothetical protein